VRNGAGTPAGLCFCFPREMLAQAVSAPVAIPKNRGSRGGLSSLDSARPSLGTASRALPGAGRLFLNQITKGI
jgi:hypothetical protein